MEPLFVNRRLSIPAECLAFTFSRSSGPGGQNVNKLNTRVTVAINIAACPVISDDQRELLEKALKGRLDKTGVLRVSCQEYRSQHANRNAALQRIACLLADGLKPVKKRRKTQPSAASIQRRLNRKKQHSRQKQQRSAKIDID